MQIKNNNSKASSNISFNNTSQFTQLAQLRRKEGVTLNDKESEYLLPHFLMLLVGKPGSGKTTMIKHLVMDREFYRGRFDSVFIISPSHAKIGLPVSASDCTSEFDLKWIYENLDKVNKRQQSKLERMVVQTQKTNTTEAYSSNDMLREVTKERVSGSSLQNISSILSSRALDIAMFAGLSKPEGFYQKHDMQSGGYNHQYSVKGNKKAKGLRGETHLASQMARVQNQLGNNVNDGRRRSNKVFMKSESLNTMPKGGYRIPDVQNYFQDFIARVSNLDKKLLSLLSAQQIEEHRTNVLLILDDVVGPIKALQNDPYLAQLFFNRRHLIANGTVSIILVTQKYTMIPARIRSNASWLILFRLNPLDFDNVYSDAFTGTVKRWKEILKFVFGDEDENLKEISKQRKNKNFDNLGIWIETDTYFSNFQQITFKGKEKSDEANQ